MDITLTLTQLQQMLQSAAKLGAAEVMRNNSSDLISKSECYRRFGRKWIDHHIAQGTITGRRRGSANNCTLYFSTSEIIALQESEMNYRIMIKK